MLQESSPADLPERRQRFDGAKARRKRQRAGGAVMLTAGLLGLGGGASTLILAKMTATKLENLAAGTGELPRGDYACRDATNPCPFVMEVQLRRYNVATPISLAVGGVAFTVGVILLAVGNRPKAEGRSRSATIAPMWMRGGGGARVWLKF